MDATPKAAAEFVSGALFGVGLWSAGVARQDVIKAQFNFTSNVMITVMMGASATSAIIIHLTHHLKLFDKTVSPPSNLGLFAFDGNVVGGMLIGIGMAVTGSCPGTSFVQAGAGESNGLFVIVGGFLGALTFVKLQERLLRQVQAQVHSKVPPALEAETTPPISKEAGTVSRSPSPELDSTRNAGSQKSTSDIAAVLKTSPFVLLLLWVPICLTVMRLAITSDRSSAARSSMPYPGLIPPAYGGLLIGCAQAATVLLTKHTIGASGGYEDIARWAESKVSSNQASDSQNNQSFFTGSVVFSVGILCASILLQQFLGASSPALIKSIISSTPAFAAKAIIGGFAMVLGARLAKGCTSGHGISGMSKFSLPSLVSTASMFAAAVLTAAATSG